VETLLPQAVLLILAVVSVLYYRNKAKKALTVTSGNV
jgi:hypothetical protein